MTDRSLPASAPAAQGVDASGVHAFLDAVEAAPGIEPHSLMILRHGRLVASGWWALWSGTYAAPAARQHIPDRRRTEGAVATPRRRPSRPGRDQRSAKCRVQAAMSSVVALPPHTTRPSRAPSPTRSRTLRAAGSRQPAAGSAHTLA